MVFRVLHPTVSLLSMWSNHFIDILVFSLLMVSMGREIFFLFLCCPARQSVSASLSPFFLIVDKTDKKVGLRMRFSGQSCLLLRFSWFLALLLTAWLIDICVVCCFTGSAKTVEWCYHFSCFTWSSQLFYSVISAIWLGQRSYLTCSFQLFSPENFLFFSWNLSFFEFSARQSL